MDMSNVSTSAPNNNDISPGFYITMEVYIILIMLVGIPGNLFTVLSVARYKRMRSSGPILVANLSLSDTMYYALVLPFRLATLLHQDWPYGNALCQAVAGVAHWAFGISMSCLACIAFNRYTHVLKPALYKRIFSQFGLTVQISIMWFLVGILTLAFPISQVWGAYSYQHHILSCTFSPDQPKSYQYFVMMVGLTIPCIFIITCYSLIYYRVRSSQKRLQSWSTNNKTTKVTPSSLHLPQQQQSKPHHSHSNEKETLASAATELHSSSQSSGTTKSTGDNSGTIQYKSKPVSIRKNPRPAVPLTKQQKQNRDSLRMTLMMVLTFALFMVCLGPYMVLGVVDSEQELPVAYLASLMLTWLNGCLNPVIYVLMNGQFRQAGQEMFCRRKVAVANKQQALNATATGF